MTHRKTIFLTALFAGLVAAAPAHADRLETPERGAANLATAAGWQAWSAPQPDGTHRLRLRRPDGTVLTPDVPAFGAPVDPAIGTRGGGPVGDNTPAGRRLSALYSRCAGTSATVGCDVHAMDLSTLREEKVQALASKTYSETAPSVTSGNVSFVRRGSGPRPGTYAFSQRGGLRRLSPTVALETATSPSRVVFTYRSGAGFGVQMRRSSGDGGAIVLASRLPQAPRSPQLTRYRAGWLLPDAGVTRVIQTQRFVGSEGRQYAPQAAAVSRTLPAGVTSGAGDDSSLFTRYLDAEGVQRIDPAIR